MVSTTGCADADASCTLEELFSGGFFTANDIKFSNFVDVGPTGAFGGSDIRVTPFGSPINGGFKMAPIDPDANPWKIAGDAADMSLSAGFTYDVEVLMGDPIGASALVVRFGDLNNRGTLSIDGAIKKVIDRLFPLSPVDLAVSCNAIDPLDCGNKTGTDNKAFGPVASLSVLETLDLEFVLVSGGGGAIEVKRIKNAFRRVVPEPVTLTLFVVGLAGLGFMMRRRRMA